MKTCLIGKGSTKSSNGRTFRNFIFFFFFGKYKGTVMLMLMLSICHGNHL